MARTARVVVPVDPVEKARWADAARKSGVSLPELVRQRMAEHDPALIITHEEAAVLKVMAAELNAGFERNTRAEPHPAYCADDSAYQAEMKRRVMAELENSSVRIDLGRLDELWAEESAD